MSAASMSPRNGAVVVGSLVADFTGFTIKASQDVASVTPYGATVMEKRVVNSTPGLDVTISAFGLAHATSTPLTLCSATGLFVAGGAATTLTIDTGVNYAGNLAVKQIEMSTSRMKSAVPVNISGQSANDWTETYATT